MEEARSVAGPGPLDRLAGGLVDREEIGAVDLAATACRSRCRGPTWVPPTDHDEAVDSA